MAGNSFILAKDKKAPPPPALNQNGSGPVPIITDIAKEKAVAEWFGFTDKIGDFVVLTFDDALTARPTARERWTIPA